MYDKLRDDWYFREDPKRRTYVFHGSGNSGKSETIASLVFVSLLKSVDLPTLGRPIIAIEVNIFL